MDIEMFCKLCADQLSVNNVERRKNLLDGTYFFPKPALEKMEKAWVNHMRWKHDLLLTPDNLFEYVGVISVSTGNEGVGEGEKRRVLHDRV